MLIDPVRLDEFDGAIAAQAADGVGHGESGREAEQLEIALAIVAARRGDEDLFALGADPAACRGALAGRRTRRKLHQHLVRDGVWCVGALRAGRNQQCHGQDRSAETTRAAYVS